MRIVQGKIGETIKGVKMMALVEKIEERQRSFDKDKIYVSFHTKYFV